MNITLHIERLILDGLEPQPGERARLQAAIESHLHSLLVTHGLAPNLMAGAAVPRVVGPELHLPADRNTMTLGHQIAQSVHATIGSQGAF